MGIAIDYLRLIETIAKRLTVPSVQSIYISSSDLLLCRL